MSKGRGPRLKDQQWATREQSLTLAGKLAEEIGLPAPPFAAAGPQTTIAQ